MVRGPGFFEPTNFPDPENGLDKLSSTELMIIRGPCQVYTTGVAAYRNCVWDELKTLGVLPPYN